MDRPTKSLIVGIVCGLAVAGLGFANTYPLKHKVKERVAACVGGVGAELGAIFCDPKAVVRDYKKDWLRYPSGDQRDLAVAQLALDAAPDWPYTLAAVIAGVLALPWWWYFFLRRAKEIREAFR